MTKRRNFSDTFKATVALEALHGGKTVQEIAEKYQLHPTQVTPDTAWVSPSRQVFYENRLSGNGYHLYQNL
ncbi:transposase [Rhodobacteraceae bacterium MYP1-1]|uniref:Transposase n=2 Tax=Halocynthiibacter styelae TaxID=2761955 RepID=A0A8J7IZT7_9RHOB|nr:transposase [Paenihalocynthiibacter styelae]